MTGALANHLWQATLIAGALGLLTLAFRKERAEVRYCLWFAASCNFLLPISLLLFEVGKHMPWLPAAKTVAVPSVSLRIEQFAQPFPSGATPALHTPGTVFTSVTLVCFAIWASGFAAVALLRLRGWRRIRTAVKSSVPLDLPAAVGIRCCPGLLEPGIVGLLHPILLLPAGIVERLTTRQLEAVLAHEVCHVRRRDNLTSAFHMLLEAIFWFHPLIWWIGAQLLEERERACDEAVLRLGIESHEYARGILEICKSYLESPLPSVPGVTGSDLKKRLQAILTGVVPRNLTAAKKFVLVSAVAILLCLPLSIGMLGAPRRTQSPVPLATATFEAASVRPCPAFRKGTPRNLSPGTFRSQCTTVQRLIEQAYGLFATGHFNPGSSLTVIGGPAWASTSLYEVNAKTPGPRSREAMNGPMLQTLLENTFKLKFHHESRETAVYSLTVAPGGPHLKPFEGTCVARSFDDPPSDADCATAHGYGNIIHLKAAKVGDLCAGFLVFLDKPVLDETGIAGRFNLDLDLSREDPAILNRLRALPALSDPRVPAPPPVQFEVARNAVQSLGLNLESAQAPGDFIVIDSIERPSPN